MNSLFKFIGLSFEEKVLIIRASALLLYFRAGLFLAPTRLAKKWIQNGESQESAYHGVREPNIGDIVRAVRLCKRFVPYATCLTQALAARRLLSRYGYDAVLKIGVAKSESKLEAHAWIEVDGKVVLGRQAFHSRYAVLETPRPILI